MLEKLESFLDQCSFIWQAHIANPIWLPRKERRQRRFNVKYRHTSKGLKKYKSFIEKLKIEKDLNSDESENNYVFSIWYQSEKDAPPLVRACFKRLRKFYGDKVKIIDKDSLKDWISLPDYILTQWEKGVITNAHFSDICRVELLYQYGGLWFDATDYLTSPVPQWVMEQDLFMFTAGEEITPSTLIQSCFIRAKKHNPLLGAWRKIIFEYWKNENKLLDYFLLHYMLRYLVETNPEAADLFSQMPKVIQNPTHILWYKYRDDNYSEDLWNEATKDTFFQKTNFKMQSAINPKRNSMADFLINGNLE